MNSKNNSEPFWVYSGWDQCGRFHCGQIYREPSVVDDSTAKQFAANRIGLSAVAVSARRDDERPTAKGFV